MVQEYMIQAMEWIIMEALMIHMDMVVIQLVDMQLDT